MVRGRSLGGDPTGSESESAGLRHRLRKDPLEQIDSGDRVVKVFCKLL